MTPATLTLAPELTVAQASALRETLLAALACAPQRLELDLSGVIEFDSAGAQLLLATRRSLAERGAVLAVTDASTAVRRGLEVLGLAHLAEPAEAAA